MADTLVKTVLWRPSGNKKNLMDSVLMSTRRRKRLKRWQSYGLKNQYNFYGAFSFTLIVLSVIFGNFFLVQCSSQNIPNWSEVDTEQIEQIEESYFPAMHFNRTTDYGMPISKQYGVSCSVILQNWHLYYRSRAVGLYGRINQCHEYRFSEVCITY